MAGAAQHPRECSILAMCEVWPNKENKMASMNVSVKVGTAAAVVLRQLKEMDVDQIRREGRCCEVLRSIREDVERFDQRFRNAPNTSISGQRS